MQFILTKLSCLVSIFIDSFLHLLRIFCLSISQSKSRTMTMTEVEERRSSEEQLEFERSEDEFSKCGKSRIVYTRALLLKFTDADACRKLPGDFDLSVLSGLNAADNGLAEHKTVSGNSSLLGACSSGRWDMGVPGERWDNHLLTPNKNSHWRGYYNSEKSDAVSQQFPHESEYALGQKTPESGPFQLKKSGNPYRPPHRNKKLPQPSDTFSELGVESSGSSTFSSVESNKTGWSDSTTVNEEPGKIEVTDAKDKPGLEIIDHDQPTYEDLWAEISEKQLPEGESSLEMGNFDDSQPTFEDLWDDILESLRQQQEVELGPTPVPDSEIEICLPDHEENADIIWPDEDSLTSVSDMLVPYSSMPTLDNDFVEADKVTTSNLAYDIRQNPDSLNGKRFYHLGKNDRVNLITKSNSDYIHYMPTLNFHTCSTVIYPSCLNTKPLVQYSLFQQPTICPMQQNRPLIDTWSGNQQTRYQGFERSNAGGFCR